MKTELGSKVYTQKVRIKIQTFWWLLSYKRVALILHVSFRISKFKWNYWLSPYNLHLLNFISEVHFFSLRFSLPYLWWLRTQLCCTSIHFSHITVFHNVRTVCKFLYCIYKWPHNHLLYLFKLLHLHEFVTSTIYMCIIIDRLSLLSKKVLVQNQKKTQTNKKADRSIWNNVKKATCTMLSFSVPYKKLPLKPSVLEAS